jgi:hypothetical protein
MKENLIHPSPEDLAAYRAGSLGPDFEQEIRNHLVVCQECQELLLELATLETSPTPTDGEVSELELEAAWRKQEQRLFPRQRLDLSRFGGWAAAAGLSFVVGILGYEVREHWGQTANFYDVDLPRVIADERDERSVAGEPPVLQLAPGQPGLVLLLLRNGLSHTSFRAELFSEEKRSLLVRSGLSGQEDLLVIQIPPALLPEGKILVTVSGRNADGDYEIVEDYSFRVQHP